VDTVEGRQPERRRPRRKERILGHDERRLEKTRLEASDVWGNGLRSKAGQNPAGMVNGPEVGDPSGPKAHPGVNSFMRNKIPGRTLARTYAGLTRGPAERLPTILSAYACGPRPR